MAKEQISGSVSRKLSVAAKQKATELGISTSRLIEIALESELGRFNVHKENKRLIEAKEQLEGQLTEITDNHLASERAKEQLAEQLTDQTKEIASALGVPDTIEHIKQRIDELHTDQDQRKQEKTQLTEQRDEFEKQLHAETDAYNKCYERAESLKKERNRFKAQAEEAKTKFETCSEKLTLLLTRNWWQRLWNTLPWIE